jgi:hypothetical protein
MRNLKDHIAIVMNREGEVKEKVCYGIKELVTL